MEHELPVMVFYLPRGKRVSPVRATGARRLADLVKSIKPNRRAGPGSDDKVRPPSEARSRTHRPACLMRALCHR